MFITINKQLRWLNYHHLYYFLIIAQEGSIAKAAQKLRIGQPTLSTQLKHLEETIGRPLFERKNRSLTLTDSGRIALEYANQVFELGSEMVEVLHDKLANNRTHIQIGALDSVPKSIVVKLIQAAYQVGPCSVSILEGKGNELFRELEAHRLDLMLSNFPPQYGGTSSIYSKKIATMDVVICGATKFKNLKTNFPESLAGQPFVLPTLHSKMRHDLEHFFKLNGIQVDVVAESQDTSIKKLLGEAGVGLIPLPEPAAKTLIQEKKLIMIGKLKSVQEDMWLISSDRKVANPIAANLIKNFQI